MEAKVEQQRRARSFRVWKQMLSSFVGRAKRRMGRILAEKASLELASNPTKEQCSSSCPLNALPDHCADKPFFKSILSKWNSILMQKCSPIFDALECSCCGIIDSTNGHLNERCHCWQTQCSDQPYKQATIQFNLWRFDSPEAPFT